METQQVPCFEEVKVEVEEEDVGSTCQEDPLFVGPQSSAWTEDNRMECVMVNVAEAVQVQHAVQFQINEKEFVHSNLSHDPLAVNHLLPAQRKGHSKARIILPETRKASSYVALLQKAEKEHYLKKLKMKTYRCELPDPYTIKDWVNNMEEWPDLNSGHIHQYLLSNQNPVSPQQTSASLYGYECFKTGRVLAVKYSPISTVSPLCFLKAKVMPPQSGIGEPQEPWVCLDKTGGSVQSSHCTCMAVSDEVCSHIAGLLFKIEAAVSLGMNNEESSSSKFAVWNSCYRSKNHIARVKDIDLSHPNKPKKSKRSFKQLKPLPLSESEQKEALDDLKKIMPNAVIFRKENSDTDTDTASENEEPKRHILDPLAGSALDVKDEDLDVIIKMEEDELGKHVEYS